MVKFARKQPMTVTCTVIEPIPGERPSCQQRDPKRYVEGDVSAFGIVSSNYPSFFPGANPKYEARTEDGKTLVIEDDPQHPLCLMTNEKFVVYRKPSKRFFYKDFISLPNNQEKRVNITWT